MLIQQGGRIDYNYKEFRVDTLAEKDALKVDDCCQGSVCFVINNNNPIVFMLNAEKEWEEI